MICEKWHINSTRYDSWRILIIKLYTFQQTNSHYFFFPKFRFLKQCRYQDIYIVDWKQGKYRGLEVPDAKIPVFITCMTVIHKQS